MSTGLDTDLDEGFSRASNAQKEYVDFLDDDNDQGIYSGLVKEMVKNQEARLLVNINDLRRKNPIRTASLVSNSFEELLAFEKALQEMVNSIDPEFGRLREHFFIGLEGSFGARHVTPRTLTARMLGQVVCVEGIVTKCSLVRPKIVKSVHYCPVTRNSMERRYTDMTSYDASVCSSTYPTQDDEGNLLETEYGLSVYKDHQTFTIQEMPEKAPPGQLPRSVDIVVDNDLVDGCNPGDRVQVVGSYRCLPGSQGQYTNGTFRSILLANHIKLQSKEVSPTISAEDVQKCKKFSRQKGDVFETLARSLAPSIHGHSYIKKALLCMLLGGVEKVLPNGTRLRGDINILLIGDPSTAKSQLLRYVLHSAPRAIATTGRGSSGVGLTAAVTHDPETGERRLEAGAMVLADRGVVAIDEFDKMSDIDRTAIHEVMEQGRVTITKAGIHAKLNARCSVLAAANPVYGRYDEYKSPMENIGMQDSLLSRFDCLFIILDTHERNADTQIANHVVRMHRYRAANEQDGEPLPIMSSADFLTTKDLETADDDDNETPIFEKYDTLLHGNRPKSEKIVSVKFMKKYIHIAKAMKPKLTQEACDAIADEYAELRSLELQHSEMARTLPITARCLETLIRLSTAHAKGRLSRVVEVKDTDAAIQLVQFAYFKKVIMKPRKQKQGEWDSDEEEGVDSDAQVTQPARRSKRTTPSEDDDDIPEERTPSKRPKRAKATTTIEAVIELSKERLQQFKSLLFREFKKTNTQSLNLDVVMEALVGCDQDFTQEEVNSALAQMQDDNKVMVADNMLFLI